jgi:hypothetical protein
VEFRHMSSPDLIAGHADMFSELLREPHVRAGQ